VSGCNPLILIAQRCRQNPSQSLLELLSHLCRLPALFVSNPPGFNAEIAKDAENRKSFWPSLMGDTRRILIRSGCDQRTSKSIMLELLLRLRASAFEITPVLTQRSQDAENARFSWPVMLSGESGDSESLRNCRHDPSHHARMPCVFGPRCVRITLVFNAEDPQRPQRTAEVFWPFHVSGDSAEIFEIASGCRTNQVNHASNCSASFCAPHCVRITPFQTQRSQRPQEEPQSFPLGGRHVSGETSGGNLWESLRMRTRNPKSNPWPPNCSCAPSLPSLAPCLCVFGESLSGF